jgi:hypothetical protein
MCDLFGLESTAGRAPGSRCVHCLDGAMRSASERSVGHIFAGRRGNVALLCPAAGGFFREIECRCDPFCPLANYARTENLNPPAGAGSASEKDHRRRAVRVSHPIITGLRQLS